MFGPLFQFLESIKLAIVLLLLLAAGGILGGILPQGAAAGELAGAHPRLSEALSALGLFDYFHSPLFFALVGLFVLNLGCCAAHRFSIQLRKKARLRFGPDILHLGLLVLVVGAVLGSAERKDFDVMLSKGDAVGLPDGRMLRLLDFEYQSYPDGRPQAWISTVEFSPAGDGTSVAKIEVNHPLRLGGLTVYQVGYAKQPSALLEGPSGKKVRLFGGESASLGEGGELLFMGESSEGGSETGAFILSRKGSGERMTLSPGGTLEGWRLAELGRVEVSGLRASRDPGFPVALAGFLLIATGLALTYIQKMKDAKR